MVDIKQFYRKWVRDEEVERAQKILSGHCSECLAEPGKHNDGCVIPMKELLRQLTERLSSLVPPK